MKRVTDIDATPTKRSYLAIVSDYKLTTAIAELIDNSIDVWTKLGKSTKLIVDIKLGHQEQTIRIEDNAGGIAFSQLHLLVQPGASSNPENGETIGIFGVGSKRAAISLAKKINIITRTSGDKAYEVAYDEAWLQHENWTVPCYIAGDKCTENHTIVKLSNLRHILTKDEELEIIHHLSRTYGILLTDQISIKINGKKIQTKKFDNWAFPEKYFPRCFYGDIETPDNQKVSFEITAGLVDASQWSSDDWGVFFYCNKRLIASGIRTPEVGFITGQAGVPHYGHSISRVIVALTGPARWMPWNSNKTGINFNHEVFKYIKLPIVDAMVGYAKISKNQQKNWNYDIFPQKVGNVEKIAVSSDSKIIPLPLPSIPPTKPSYSSELKQINESILKQDPWKDEVLDTFVVFSNLEKQKTKNRNTILLIVLDYLAFTAYKRLINMDKFAPKDGKFKDMDYLSNALRGYKISDLIISDIKSIHNKRDQIFTSTESILVSDSQIRKYRESIQILFYKCFSIKFPSSNE